MREPLKLEPAVAKGVAYLTSEQRPNGSFDSFSSATILPFRPVRSWQTTFVPALMLIGLAACSRKDLKPVRRQLAHFLLQQRSLNGSFNYWSKDAAEQQSLPYPDDLDDTFCALAGLYLHESGFITQEVLAQSVKLLLATETQTGGPYRTWLAHPDSPKIWLDVDVAVNANIAYFLSLVGSSLPNLKQLIEQAIVSDTFASPYYPTIYPFMYYFARAYRGKFQPQLLEKIQRLHSEPGLSALDSALLVSARLRLGDTDVARPISELLQQQCANGSWPAAAFYADPVKDGKLYYNGAPALTTAMVIEALSLYAQIPQAKPAKLSSQPVAAPFSELVLLRAQKYIQALGPDLKAVIAAELANLAAGGNGREIFELPLQCNLSLKRPLAGAEAMLQTLGLANAFGWLAYTVYDDFLDEAGQPRLLPAAIAASRRSLRCFAEAIPDDKKFQKLVEQTFDSIDGANAWELTHCRFTVRRRTITIKVLPDYGDLSKLAERSLGHTLAPIAVVLASGIATDSRLMQQLRTALRHYLIARQLNDDLHDWQPDLSNGHISYVVASILHDLNIEPGRQRLSILLPKVREQFWYHSLPKLCSVVEVHLQASREALTASGFFVDGSVLERLLDGLQAAINDARNGRQEAIDFLKYYSKDVAAA